MEKVGNKFKHPLSGGETIVETLLAEGTIDDQVGDEEFEDFDGTSAASAIIAGAMVVACNVAKALDPQHRPLAPEKLRELLIRTGTPQCPYFAEDKHIGPQPNVPALLRAIRSELYDRHNLPVPRGAEPTLSGDERWVLSLVANGLEAKPIAEIMRRPEGEVEAIRSALAAKLGADTPLGMARAGDHWGLL